MYFLNGDRIFIKPLKVSGTLDEQMKNCLTQLLQFSSERKIFKLNFFVDAESDEVYNQLNSEIRLQVSQLIYRDYIKPHSTASINL